MEERRHGEGEAQVRSQNQTMLSDHNCCQIKPKVRGISTDCDETTKDSRDCG